MAGREYPNKSWLQPNKYYLKDFLWRKDSCGYYWDAAVFDKKTDKQECVTGSYGIIDDYENNKRASKKKQMEELNECGKFKILFYGK